MNKLSKFLVGCLLLTCNQLLIAQGHVTLKSVEFADLKYQDSDTISYETVSTDEDCRVGKSLISIYQSNDSTLVFTTEFGCSYNYNINSTELRIMNTANLNVLATNNRQEYSIFYNLQDSNIYVQYKNKLLRTIHQATSVNQIKISPKAKYYTTLQDGYLSIRKIKDPAFYKEIPVHSFGVTQLDDKYLYFKEDKSSTILKYCLSTGELLTKIEISNPIVDFIVEQHTPKYYINSKGLFSTDKPSQAIYEGKVNSIAYLSSDIFYITTSNKLMVYNKGQFIEAFNVPYVFPLFVYQLPNKSSYIISSHGGTLVFITLD